MLEPHAEVRSSSFADNGVVPAPDPASFERAHYIRTLHSWMR